MSTILAYRQHFLSPVNRVVVSEGSGSCRCHRHIESITVVHFVEFVLGLQISRLGIGQYAKGLPGDKNTMIFHAMVFRLFFVYYQ